MDTISANQFRKRIQADPSWASHITSPLRINGNFELVNSPITHLSPHLQFAAPINPDTPYPRASFIDCKDLKVAEGSFFGGVCFQNSGIERIGKLHAYQHKDTNYSASFEACGNLQCASGEFHGLVIFTGSKIKTIQNLVVKTPSPLGHAADFNFCPDLETATGTYPGFVGFQGSGIHTIKELVITAPNKNGKKANFMECENLQEIPPRIAKISEMFAPKYLIDKLIQTQSRNLLRRSQPLPDIT